MSRATTDLTSSSAFTTSARRADARLRAVLPDRAGLATMGRSPRKDLLAGLTVAIVALPLALGFGVASGAGAEAGLATAVVAGALAAFFGGSNLQVSGPTGAMTVVLVPIVHQYGTEGVLTVGLMAGVLLIAAALGGAGRFMAYVPAPVVEGFTLGIAGVIGLQQVPAALGVKASGAENVVVTAWDAVADFAGTPHLAPLALAGGVALIMLVGARLRPGVPFSLIAVIAATLVTGRADPDVATIGHLPAGLPAPSLGFLHLGAVPHLATAALAVAALAALESLMSATAADAMSVSERHDSDRELFGQGVANLVAPLFGGVAATGAIARTAVNVRSGAASRLAALVHAAVLAVVVFAAAPLVEGIPLAALAGVLIATAIRMVEVASLRALARSGRGEAAILALTAAATLAFDLVTAVIVGLLVAGALALRQVARSAALTRVGLHEGLPPADHHAEEQALLAEHIVAYRIDGPVFFAGAHRFLLQLAETTDVKAVILRLSRVSAIDATGALVLKDAIAKLERRGILVLVSGAREDHLKTLDALGVLDALHAEHRVFAATPDAIGYARRHLTPR
ncbi:SulP family inorganic anion transporter [Streptomyces sp. CB01881]|uniref:SulP family inorganic anion transporter n=1 Tax=Streptomyces sp. CB01881 TaxID=2078691 RepID=UPI000CDC430B|nr:SulP family inorganic anion transporter [Streptomyces sp. CB01881]AUY47754.1 sodium-independent anion transporter [Streptomyces sp. CB01881]TYC76231.1 SulP family inorganic anion transporter [Streptomyces sp. CB01881]